MKHPSSKPTLAEHVGNHAAGSPTSSVEALALPRSEAGLELEYPVRVDSLSRLGHIPFMFWIVDALRPRTIVELGVGKGNSYLAFLQAASHLNLDVRCSGVDHWMGRDGEKCYRELSAYHDPLYGVFSTLLRSPFDEAAAYFADGTIDLLHIDGTRSYNAISRDFSIWLPKMSARGIVMFHDTNIRSSEYGARRIWEEANSRYPTFEFLHGNGLGIAYVGSEPARGRLKTFFDKAQANATYVRSYFARLGISVHEHVALLGAEAHGTNAGTRLQALEAELARATKAQNALEQELQGARAKLARRDSLRQQTVIVMRLQREVSVLNGKKLEWEQIRQSTSWRITAPLRWVVNKARSLRSKLSGREVSGR